MPTHRNGLIVAAHRLAADAGADILAAGGNAVDAAVAVATALAVVDPANCGIGGYGGAMVVHHPGHAGATQLDFNTRVPAAFDAAAFLGADRSGRFVHGGPSVSWPGVVPGLLAAHAAFGTLPLGDAFAPAIAQAARGIAVSRDLENSLAWAVARHRGLSPGFRRIFFGNGQPLRQGDALRQPELAESLGYIAAHGAGALRDGALVDAIVTTTAAAGGALGARDFAHESVAAAPAQRGAYRDAIVHGPSAQDTGFGILTSTLQHLTDADLGSNRSAQYIGALFSALAQAWTERRSAAENLVAGARHTSHFCTADADGMLVSVTFTHGPLWFGSGLVAAGTGILLNAGANLFVRAQADGRIFPQTNLTPVILETSDGHRHAIGSPGGVRIPAIVLQMILDRVRYGVPLGEGIALPRMSVGPGGDLEAEADLAALAGSVRATRIIAASEYYGPACALSVSASGEAVAACDPRFMSAVAAPAPQALPGPGPAAG